MITKNFDREYLEEIGLPYNALFQQDLEERRWGTMVRCVFQHEGKLWAVDWYRPATEMQEGQDDWDDQDPVPGYRVAPQPHITVSWEPV